MMFTPSEHAAMLARAKAALDARDHRTARRQRAASCCALAVAVAAAAYLWWPRPAGEPGAAGPGAEPGGITMAPEPGTTRPLPPWLEYITTDEELEAGFAEAGQCARVVHVDHKIMTFACSELEAGTPPPFQ